MSHSSGHITKDEVPLNFLFENSAFLIAGTIAALFWAYFSPETHHNLFHFPLRKLLVETYDSHGNRIDDPSALHGAHGHSDGHADDGHTDDEHADDGQTPTAHDDAADHSKETAAAAVATDATHTDTTDTADQHDEAEHTLAANTSPDGAGHTEGDQAGHKGEDTHGDGSAIAHEDMENRGHPLTLSFIINDLFMAVFFAIATKEVWESMLPGGSLSNPRKAALPLLATFGGVFGPALVFLIGAAFCGWGTYANGWAVPCATDIAFSYLVARLIFGSTHPAIAFLLLLAIADDAVGLAIIAVFYPQGPLQLQWVLLTLAAMILTYTMRKCRIHSFWWYLLIPGAMAWFSFYKSGIHAALGLVPIIPLMPHAQTDLGVFAKDELERNDTLNEFEHWWKRPVELFLGLFGLCNAAVPLTGVGAGTWLVLAGLLIGKPVGITLCTLAGEKFFNLKMPEGMDYKQIVTIGFVAAIGFTVALFVSTSAFMDAPLDVQNSVKMGALLSFGAAVVAFIVAKCLGVKPWRGGAPTD